jgi:hypothetical protein
MVPRADSTVTTGTSCVLASHHRKIRPTVARRRAADFTARKERRPSRRAPQWGQLSNGPTKRPQLGHTGRDALSSAMLHLPAMGDDVRVPQERSETLQVISLCRNHT